MSARKWYCTQGAFISLEACRVPRSHSCVLSILLVLQVIAYNKIDLPDSGDYIEEVREFLLGRGLAPEDVHAISAVTGQGVIGVVRRARELLDQLPSEVSTDLLVISSCAQSGVCSRGCARNERGNRAGRARRCQRSSRALGSAAK